MPEHISPFSSLFTETVGVTLRSAALFVTYSLLADVTSVASKLTCEQGDLDKLDKACEAYRTATRLFGTRITPSMFLLAVAVPFYARKAASQTGTPGLGRYSMQGREAANKSVRTRERQSIEVRLAAFLNQGLSNTILNAARPGTVVSFSFYHGVVSRQQSVRSQHAGSLKKSFCSFVSFPVEGAAGTHEQHHGALG